MRAGRSEDYFELNLTQQMVDAGIPNEVFANTESLKVITKLNITIIPQMVFGLSALEISASGGCTMSKESGTLTFDETCTEKFVVDALRRQVGQLGNLKELVLGGTEITALPK